VSVIKAVVGLDLSLTSSGLAILRGEEDNWCYPITRPDKPSPTGYMVMACAVVENAMVGLHGLRALWIIEGYAYRAPNGMAASGELGGLVKYLLARKDELFVVVSPGQLKKFATGRGDAQKDQMRLGVFKAWGVEAKTTDEIDAYAAARLGATALGWFEPTNQAQRECVFEVRKQLRGLGLEVPSELAEAKARKGRAKPDGN